MKKKIHKIKLTSLPIYFSAATFVRPNNALKPNLRVSGTKKALAVIEEFKKQKLKQFTPLGRVQTNGKQMWNM